MKIAVASLLLAIGFSLLPAMAQVATGSYPYATYQNLGFDAINVGNLNVHFSIPLLNKPGRGLPFYYNLSYDSSVWYPATVNGSKVWSPTANFGWRGDTEITTGYVSFSRVTENGRIRGSGGLWYTCPTTTYSEFVYHDPFGVSHSFPTVITIDTSQQPPECNPPPSHPNASGLATDGSGYTMNVTSFDVTAMTSRTGQNVATPSTPSGGGTVTDSNGNEISVSSTGVFTDTVGTQVLTVAGGAPNPETFTYLDTHGNQQLVKVYYTQYTVQTDFGCSGIGEFGPTSTYLVSSIVFPDNSTYAFSYEATPNSSGNVTGRLASVTLPQGGVISYYYTGGNDGMECADASTAGLQREIAASAGSAASTWTFTRTTGSGTSQTTVTDGLNNQSVYNFIEASNQTGTAQYFETGRSVYQGSATGTPLLARVTCYNLSTPPAQTCSPATFSLPITEIDTYNTLNGLEEDGATAKYNSYGSQTDEYDYDYATSGSRGALLRHEVWGYNADIAGLVSSDEVYDGSGNAVAYTGFTYDTGSVTATSNVPQHVAVSGPRGNLDQIKVDLGAAGYYYTCNSYYDTGSIESSTANCQTQDTFTTTYSYDSTYTFQTGTTPPTPSSGVSLATSSGYDQNTGLLLNASDPNGNQTSYGYDSMLRMSQVTDPDSQPNKTYSYSYTPTEITAEGYQNASTYSETDVQLDAYDRQSRMEQSNGQSSDPWYQRDVCFDADGNLSFRSYSYQSTGFGASKVCSGAGDAYTYDALGRITNVTHSDGTSISYTYGGRATKITDEEGVTRISQMDGLGRTTAVCEVSSDSSMPDSGSPVSCGLDIAGFTGFLTNYTYDLNNHETTVTQGTQSRVFQTDWIGRPISLTEPESGQTTYTYAYNTTGLAVTRTRPKANQTSSGVTTATTYQYDSVGRPVGVSYSDGTPTKAFIYDQPEEWGTTLSNPKGRLVYDYTGSGNTGAIYSYDPMGRVNQVWECTPSTCGTTTHWGGYGYDWLGNLLYSWDGGGVTNSYTYSTANEVQSITSSQNDSTHPPDLVSNVQNGPFGPLSWQLGNGLTAVRQYDAMGRVQGGYLCSGSSQANCSGGTTVYYFTSYWAGNYLTGTCDQILNQCIWYYYDSLGRLATRDVNSGTPGSYTYVYDRWGNRWNQNAENGGPSPQLTFNTTTNQISTSGFTYDAAGNMTSDGTYTYTYDADGNLTAVNSGTVAAYTYNALNQRVQVSVAGSDPQEFFFNPAGQRASIWDGTSGAQDQGQTYWGGMPVSYYQNGYVHFEHQDWVGTERMTTKYNAAVEGTYQSLPFGDGYAASGADDDPYHFAGLDQDNSSNDHAWFREYSNMTGRWMSPDPYAGSYDAGDPQSMNRYAYAMNSPLGFIDPLGLFWQYDPAEGCMAWYVYTPQGVSMTGCSGPPPGPSLGGDSGGVETGGGGGGGGGGGPDAPNDQPPCISPNPFQAAAIRLLSPAANFLGRTLGFGVGGSIGVGEWGFGFNFSASQQLVVAPDGTAGLATTYTKQLFGVASQGVGGIFGLQFSGSTAQSISDLQGYSLDIGGLASDDEGEALGGDATFSPGNSLDMGLTGTLGIGFGGYSHAGSLTQTIVTPFCAN